MTRHPMEGRLRTKDILHSRDAEMEVAAKRVASVVRTPVTAPS
jgi:hypothetical protein